MQNQYLCNKFEDTVLCGNSIWQELVTETEDVGPNVEYSSFQKLFCDSMQQITHRDDQYLHHKVLHPDDRPLKF